MVKVKTLRRLIRRCGLAKQPPPPYLMLMPADATIRLTALLSGPDRPGLVARTANWIFERGGNILHADQHCDDDANVFFQRIEWLPAAKADPAAEAAEFQAYAAKKLGMTARVVPSSARPRVAIFASKAGHCFHDLILRFRAGEMRGELACVIANHPGPGRERENLRPAVFPHADHAQDQARGRKTAVENPARTRRRPRRPRALHADFKPGVFGRARFSRSSTSTIASCPPLPARSPTIRPTRAASRSSAPPRTTSRPCSTKAPSSRRTSATFPIATTWTTCTAAAATSKKSSSPKPCAGTSKTASWSTATRPWCLIDDSFEFGWFSSF